MWISMFISQEISSMFLIACSVLLQYSSMYLRLSLIHFSLTESNFFRISSSNFSYFSLASFFPSVQKCPLSSTFVFFLTLGIRSTTAFVIIPLNFAHCWSSLSASPRTSIYFEQPHGPFLEGSGWILIKPS